MPSDTKEKKVQDTKDTNKKDPPSANSNGIKPTAILRSKIKDLIKSGSFKSLPKKEK